MIRKYYRFFLFINMLIAWTILNLNTVLSEGIDEYVIKVKTFELQRLITQKRSEGIDISRALMLDDKSREAMHQGRSEECLRLLEEAISLLKGTSETEEGLSFESVSPEKDENSAGKIIIELPVSTSRALITSSVSDCVSGENISDYSRALEYKTLNAKDGKVQLELSSVPIFVEEVEEEGAKKQSIDYQKSPFGIHGIGDSYDQDIPYLKDLGVKWVRYAGKSGIVWDLIEPQKGKFNWSYNDSLFLKSYKEGLNMVITILTPNRWDQSVRWGATPIHKMPVNIESYRNFLRKLVERYDGDGINDAPGSPIVKYYQIQNEPDLFWKDTPENFAKFLKISYQTIKENNRETKVVLAGVGLPKGFQEFYVPMLRSLDRIKDNPGDRYFDIFDLHWWEGGTGGYKETLGHSGDKTDLESCIKSIQNTLRKYGYNVPIWITEMASYSGQPKQEKINFAFETEKQQAIELFKRYIYSLFLGVEKVFWVTLTEWHNFDSEGINNYFDNVGLVNNPKNDGESHKKIAYYTYKLMVDKLEGVDWEKIEQLELGGCISCYKFTKANKTIYVLWI